MPEELVNIHVPGPCPQIFDSGGLQQNLSICIPTELPSGAGALAQHHSESTDWQDPVLEGQRPGIRGGGPSGGRLQKGNGSSAESDTRNTVMRALKETRLYRQTGREEVDADLAQVESRIFVLSYCLLVISS